MTKTVTASEAKNRLGALIRWALSHKQEVIVKSRGEPKVVIMPYPAYQAVVEMREQARREQALDQLKKLRRQVQARNQDLTEAQASQLADRLTRETVEEMVQEDKIHHQAE